MSVWLKEDRGKGKIGSVGYKCRGKQRVKMAKERSGGKRKFECLEGMFGGFAKASERCLGGFCGQCMERGSKLGVMVNKLMIKIRKTEKGLNLFNCFWLGPVDNGSKFFWIHLNPWVEMMKPKYWTQGCSNSHFSALAKRWVTRRHCKTCLTKEV